MTWGQNSGSDWIHRPTRLAIYERDGWRCIACLVKRQRRVASGLSLDHFVPRSQGGSHEPRNLVTFCIWCNSSRQDRPLHLWALDAGLDATKLMTRVRAAREKPIDPLRGRVLCDRLWPGWLARREARGVPGDAASFPFGALA